jgi:hypothetical protein
VKKDEDTPVVLLHKEIVVVQRVVHVDEHTGGRRRR